MRFAAVLEPYTSTTLRSACRPAAYVWHSTGAQVWHSTGALTVQRANRSLLKCGLAGESAKHWLLADQLAVEWCFY